MHHHFRWSNIEILTTCNNNNLLISKISSTCFGQSGTTCHVAALRTPAYHNNRTLYHYYYYYYYYYYYSALGPVWAETRVQSGDCYGSGMLHPGQVLRGSLPLLSPPFSCSHFSPPGASTSPTTWEIPAAEVGTVGENVVPVILPKWWLPRHLGNFYVPQIYDMGPTALLTSPPKEGVLRIFSPLKM